MSERPNPLVLAGTLRSLAECWTELDGELNRTTAAGSPGGRSAKVPLDLDVAQAKADIERFAVAHAHMLMDETDDWAPVNAHPTALLEALAMRIGHFTHHAKAKVAHTFEEELNELSETAWGVARPNGKVPIPIGPCFAKPCPGVLHVTIDRDTEVDRSSLALWRPNAMCRIRDQEGKYQPNPSHQIDAKVYAKSLEQHADTKGMTQV